MPTAAERQQIANITASLRDVAQNATKDIGRTVINELAEKTPKDTGFTAANWRASVGRPVTRTVGNRSTRGVGRAKAAQEASRGAIEGYRLGPTLHVANPSPNAGALNNGTSRKAPAAFVQRAIAKAARTAAARATGRDVGRRRGGA